MASSSVLKLSLLLFTIFLSITSSLTFNTASTSNSPDHNNGSISSMETFCKSRPYTDACFDSLKLSISINISPNIINYILQTLQIALAEAGKVTNLFSRAGPPNIVERQRGTIQDCKELHQITVSALQKTVPKIRSAQEAKTLADIRSYLSAALTNKNTCLESLSSASGSLKSTLADSVTSTYKHVSNSLSALPKPAAPKKASEVHYKQGGNRRLLEFPTWLSRKDRRILQSSDSGDEYDPGQVLTVAADGKGDFTTISDAINFAPNNSDERIVIQVKAGIYRENVEITSDKTNIVLLGDGRDSTIIVGNRSVGDGWTTFRSATVAVSGEGFLARDITIENDAGPEKYQAVALRVNADFVAFFQCGFYGFQDTLYVHSFRQFYRECDIYGTIDYIFGNAAVVFQGCNIVSRMPMPGQFTVITAQSKEDPEENTGISVQNCSILATEDLYGNASIVNSYLGRPWRNYSTTVILESYIDDFIEPAGWTEWSGDQGLDTLYYGEYNNYGPGSGTDNRVNWSGYHVMEYYDAYYFTVSELITGDEWLDSTSIPYDDGI